MHPFWFTGAQELGMPAKVNGANTGSPKAVGSRDPKPDKLATVVDGGGVGWRMGLYER